jgi:serine/threonine protein kinase
VQELMHRERPDKHPRTLEVCVDGRQLFFKIFSVSSLGGAVKDCFRRSKAVRALFACESLMEAGFNAPVSIGAGEERYANLLRRSFLVSLPVDGCSLPEFLQGRAPDRTPVFPPRRKREMLRRLARDIRRLHDHGFVHGDLVPGNIFAMTDGRGLARFCFMDNDRTRRYPAWLKHRLWRRNLVQLNRFPLAGISLQDRMRFFHAYLDMGELGSKERKLLHWLERKTRQRRRECDAVDTSGNFRELMRWKAPVP